MFFYREVVMKKPVQKPKPPKQITFRKIYFKSKEYKILFEITKLNLPSGFESALFIFIESCGGLQFCLKTGNVIICEELERKSQSKIQDSITRISVHKYTEFGVPITILIASSTLKIKFLIHSRNPEQLYNLLPNKLGRRSKQ